MKKRDKKNSVTVYNSDSDDINVYLKYYFMDRLIPIIIAFGLFKIGEMVYKMIF